MVFNKIIILSAICSVHSFNSHPSTRPFLNHQITTYKYISHNNLYTLQPLSSTSISDDIDESDNKSSSIDNNTADDTTVATSTTKVTQTTEDVLSEGVQKVFSIVDIDNSGSIDWNEYYLALSSTDYTNEEITESFKEIDTDGNGEISREEFQFAIQKLKTEKMNKRRIDEDCPMGYWLNSVEQTCQPLGPIGRISQQIETLPRFKGMHNRLSNVFGIDKAAIRKKGVSFALAYSIISNLNGAISLSVAWYMTVKRVSSVYTLGISYMLCLLVHYILLYILLINFFSSLPTPHATDWYITTSTRTKEGTPSIICNDIWRITTT